ncbi:MAG: sodium-dependent bicarbonate transport family permease [Pseudomonadota bacterium]
MDFLSLALDNLGAPMVLCFLLGLGAALARADLSIPEQAARMMSIYLLFAIGMKGGVEVARVGFGPEILMALVTGVALSILLPLVAFSVLRVTTGLSAIDAAAAAGHYGSISIVTFVAGTQALENMGLAYSGYMVAVAAAMEAPAIIAALWLAARGGAHTKPAPMREILLNGSIVLLCGAVVVGWIAGPPGFESVKGLFAEPFKGVLCLFLLDMGLLAGRHLRSAATDISRTVIAFGIYMPLIGAAIGGAAGWLIGLTPGDLALLITLSASASYIAAPAALRVALPKANPAIYLTLSLGLTFPFNLTFGIPIYVALAETLAG